MITNMDRSSVLSEIKLLKRLDKICPRCKKQKIRQYIDLGSLRIYNKCLVKNCGYKRKVNAA